MTIPKVLILDNGAYNIKCGYADAEKCRLIPNCVTKAKNERKRIFVGDQIQECKDLSSLFFILPFQKGYLVNFETEHQVWDYAFGKEGFNVEFDETCLMLTEPHFNFPSIQESINEILFEDYQFQSALRVNSSTLSAYKYLNDHPTELCYVVLDCGYSFGHVVPYCKGTKIKEAILRLNVGGKALTNYLKELVSYRQLNVMEETYVINQMKEDLCFVSTDFDKDIQIAKHSRDFVNDYVLPDFLNVQRGYVKDADVSTTPGADEQVIRVNHERFTIPELLFRPSDVGINEVGVAEGLAHCITQKCPEIIQPHLTNNVVLTGGCCLFDGFAKRVQNELRSLIPDEFDVRIFVDDDPISYAWRGGCLLSRADTFGEMIVTREKYNEIGHNVCYEKFNV